MSAKKGSSVLPVWFTCSKCDRRFNRQHAAKHGQNCDLFYPFIQSNNLFCTIAKIPEGSPLGQISFLDSPSCHSTLFASEEILPELGFVTFSWVLLSNVKENEEMSSSIPFRIWPKSCDEKHGVCLSSQAIETNCLIEGQIYSILKMKVQKWSIAHEISIEISESDSAEFVSRDPKQFAFNFKKNFTQRIVTLGNVFKLSFYTQIIKFKIISICENGEDNLILQMNKLNMDDDNKYYEITKNTIIRIIQPKVKENKEIFGMSINEIGGLDEQIKELLTALNFILGNNSEIEVSSNGIMIYGNHGTGKSTLINAVCKFLKLNVFRYTETSFSNPNSLSSTFYEAIKSQPSAVIIENLENLCSSKSNFGGIFQREISQVPRPCQIVYFVTCSNLDALDSTLRSPHIFTKEIELPIPSVNERREILWKLLNKSKHSLSPEQILSIASETHGFVGADLQGLISQSALDVNKGRTKSILPFTFGHMKESMKIIRPSAIKNILVEVPHVKWDDIGGQDDLKLKLKQAIEWPLKHPHNFQRLGIKPPKGILLYGPPGCSKTMIAKAIATESQLNFLTVKASELFSKWVGESEKAVQSLFRKARQVSPAVLFFDEIDSLSGERGSNSGSSSVHERVLAQLLIEMDGIEPLNGVTIVAATNRPDIIDQALLRPGRLDRIIYVPLPDKKTRREIFKIRFRKMPIDPDFDLECLVIKTENYSGAEIIAVCHEAALKALEEDMSSMILKANHFNEALTIIRPRTSKETIQFYEAYSKR